MASDTKDLIELGIRRFLDEVPALKQLKLVFRLDLRARRDSQTWRVELPALKIGKKGVWRVSREALEAYLTERAEESKARAR